MSWGIILSCSEPFALCSIHLCSCRALSLRVLGMKKWLEDAPVWAFGFGALGSNLVTARTPLDYSQVIFKLQYEVWSAWDCSAKRKCNFSVVSMLYILRFWITKFRLVCDSHFFSHMVMAVATGLFPWWWFWLVATRLFLFAHFRCMFILQLRLLWGASM